MMMLLGAAEAPVLDQRRRWERKRERTARELGRIRSTVYENRSVNAPLLETEQTYVEELELITKFYDEVFRARCSGLKLAQEGICGTIPSIVKVNRSLLMSLERDMLSSGFQTFSQYLHLYRKHSDCIEATRHMIQVHMKKTKSFSRFMKLQESRPEFRGRNLQQLLELPLQRVLRYRHFLLDLVENTIPGTSDSAQLNGSLRAVSDLGDHMEERKDLQENHEQLQRVQKLLKGRRVRVLEPGRRYVREGWLSLVPPSGEDVKPRMLFLFSDVLLVTAPCHPLHPFNSDKFCCRAVYPLRECQVEKVLGHAEPRRSPQFVVQERETSVHVDQSAGSELVRTVRFFHKENVRPSRTEASQGPQRVRTELQNSPAARAPKRPHVREDPPADVLSPSQSQEEEPLCKRQRTERSEKENAHPGESEGSGWKCTIL